MVGVSPQFITITKERKNDQDHGVKWWAGGVYLRDSRQCAAYSNRWNIFNAFDNSWLVLIKTNHGEMTFVTVE